MISSSRKVSVLLVSHEYPPYTFGGVASYVKELAEGLSQFSDINVTVVAGRSDHHQICFEKKKENLSIVRLWFPNKPVRSLWFQVFGKKIILTLAKYHDIIHINPPDGSLLLPELKKLGKYLVSTFHGSMLEQLKLFTASPIRDQVKYSTFQDIGLYTIRGQHITMLERSSYDLCDYSVFVARHVMEEFTRYYGSKRGLRRIIYPGINFLRCTDNLLNSPQSNIFFYTGRLYYLKGPQYSIQAFKKYLEYENAAELHIYGNGPLQHKLKRAVKDYVPCKIKFLGFLERGKYLDKVPMYKAMVFPSLYEGCPISMLEALSMGIPIISFNAQWIQEFKDMFTDLLKTVKMYDIEELSTSMVNIHKIKMDHMENIQSHFLKEKFVKKVKTMYLELKK